MTTAHEFKLEFPLEHLDQFINWLDDSGAGITQQLYWKKLLTGKISVTSELTRQSLQRVINSFLAETKS